MDKIQLLFNEWQQLQPLNAENEKRLEEKFRLEFNYNSNHIDGNALTYGQTKLLLLFGEATGDAKMRDLEEMKAHNSILRWVESIAKNKNRELKEIDILRLNRSILIDDYWKINPHNNSRFQIKVGVYKTRPNSVITATGEEFLYASPEETPVLMSGLMRWFNEQIKSNELSVIELAALFHYRYTRIHPFEDGNGRIARLLVTYVLTRFGYPMIVIKGESNRSEYLRVLHLCDVNVGLTPADGANASLDDIVPFVEYMKRQLEWSLDIAVKAAKGESIEESEDWKKELQVKFRDKIGMPEYNDGSKLRIEEHIIKPLKVRMEQEFNQYYNLFDKVALDSRTFDGIDDGDDGNLFFRMFFDKNNMSYVVIIKVIFNKFSYKIELQFVDNDHNMIKLFQMKYYYDALPSEDDITKIINVIGQQLPKMLD